MSNQITPNPSVPSQVVAEVKFPRWINNLGIIPTSYKDSMSYYECLAWLCKFLEETVIPSVNENGEAVEELQALYIELNSYVTHYFETLDVQEEINNKLDDMVEDGTLPEIIADYLNSKAVFGFDTVADMKNATNLINGSYAKTLGFYEKNDGGEGLYKIRTITNDDNVDEAFIIEMNDEQNQLIAELIINEPLNLKSIGLKSEDSNFNNTLIIQKLENYKTTIKTYIPSGNFYFSSLIEIDNIDLLMEQNTKLILNSNNIIDCFIKIRTSENADYSYNNKIIGGIINCNYKANTGIGMNNSRNFEISSKFYNFNNVGINTCYVTKSSTMLASAESFIHDCFFINQNKVTGTSAIKDNGNDNMFNNIITQDIETGVEIGSGSSLSDLHCWCSSDVLYPTTTSVKIIGYGNNLLNNIISDTMATAIWISIPYTNIICNNLYYYYSTNVLDSETITNAKPEIFKFSEGDLFALNNANITLNNETFYLMNNSSYNYFMSTDIVTRFLSFSNILYRGATNLQNRIITEDNNSLSLSSYKKLNNMPLLDRSTNYDLITESGLYFVNTWSGTGGTNIPNESQNTAGLMLVSTSKDYNIQLLIGIDRDKIFTRTNSKGTWSHWKYVILTY